MHTQITQQWEVKGELNFDFISERMSTREWVIVVRVLEGIATPFSIYKDSDDKLYVKKYIDMRGINTEAASMLLPDTEDADETKPDRSLCEDNELECDDCDMNCKL